MTYTGIKQYIPFVMYSMYCGYILYMTYTGIKQYTPFVMYSMYCKYIKY
jgi:hypothetical protein